jgi:drug/metabolite transporter (DMT)-like permease
MPSRCWRCACSSRCRSSSGSVCPPARRRRPERRRLGRIVILGCLGYYGASILDFWGLQYISAGLERLILFTYPTLTILIGVLFQGKAFSWREGAALVLCYTGIGFAFVHDLGLADSRDVWIGGGLVFASSVAYAIYLAGSAPMIPAGRDALLGAGDAGVDGGDAAAFRCRPAAFRLHPAAAGLWLEPGDGAVRHGHSGLRAGSAAIRQLGAGRTTLYGMIGPLLTIGFGWWLLDEAISAAQLAGAALVVAGILIVSRR